MNITQKDSDVTIVTGLWNIGRGEMNNGFSRSYEDYKERFANLLKSSVKMFIYVSKEDEEFVWQHRSKENTFVKVIELSEFETWFEFFGKVQEIRQDNSWYNQAAWLPNSPQARLQYYNPIVMSKMFMLNDATLFNPFNTTNFFWIDAGITNTVHEGYFSHDNVFANLPALTQQVDRFIFLSYPYEGGTEIHGFERSAMALYSNTEYVKYVCRGGFFGGTKKSINLLNTIYYDILSKSMKENHMGTEESIFTIIAHQHPELIYQFMLSADGLVWPFFEAMKDVQGLIKNLPSTTLNVKTAKSTIYILSFNSPDQFKSTAEAIKIADSEMFNTCRKILINNSTDETTYSQYDEFCNVLGFEEIHRENLGICGGRQFIAEHFEESDADFYLFFEDDMMINPKETENEVCRNGFRKYIPNLYETIVGIIIKENFDFLKLSFSEFYGDNSKQWAWYNVPQTVRTELWPNYDKLPEYGLDLNSPKTKFNTIGVHAGVAYITGDVYYSNWPQIVSKAGNKKMFLNTKWEHPFEQTWMSHMFQETVIGRLNPAVLLASPINHNRIHHYMSEERREN